MAIVPMLRVHMTGMKEEQGEILEALQEYGVLEIESPDSAEGLSPAATALEQSCLKEKLEHAERAISILSPYQLRKKSILQKQETSFPEHIQKIRKQEAELCSKVQYILQLASEGKSLQEKAEIIEKKQKLLLPYRQYALPLSLRHTASTCILLGSLPKEVPKPAPEEKAAAEIFTLGTDEENRYIAAVCYAGEEKSLRELLVQYGFEPLTVDTGGTAAKQYRQMEEEKQALLIEAKKRRKALKKEADVLSDLKRLCDFYLCRAEQLQQQTKLLESKFTFFLTGWIPRGEGTLLREKLTERFPFSYMTLSEPEEGEEPPVYLRNSFFVRPFELVTDLYSPPSPYEVDPNPVMSLFYVVFFGMMLSDAGYGIVLSLLTGIFLLVVRPQGTMEKLFKLIFFGGISTIFWGVLFGGWFGDLLSGVPAFRPRWFNPLEDPMTLLLWSFVFGGIHIVVGMGVKAWLLIRQGDWLSAIFDIGLWYLLFAGLILWFFGGGYFLALLGAIGLVLTQGRQEKNPVKKLSKGLLSLYDVTGFLSDILSYSRLLALGLATGVIGQVVNTMASLGGNGIFGRVMFVAVLLVGHTFNLAINTLGAYVHASRLQYVEFYGKFYSGGGRPFQPLRLVSKYFSIHQ